MIPEIYNDFIDKLLSKTDANEVKWAKGIDNELFLRNKNSQIEIGRYSDDDSELSFIYFYFYNYNTKNESRFRVSNQELGYEKMEDLYTVAMSNANDISNELKNFFEE